MPVKVEGKSNLDPRSEPGTKTRIFPFPRFVEKRDFSSGRGDPHFLRPGLEFAPAIEVESLLVEDFGKLGDDFAHDAVV